MEQGSKAAEGRRAVVAEIQRSNEAQQQRGKEGKEQRWLAKKHIQKAEKHRWTAQQNVRKSGGAELHRGGDRADGGALGIEQLPAGSEVCCTRLYCINDLAASTDFLRAVRPQQAKK